MCEHGVVIDRPPEGTICASCGAVLAPVLASPHHGIKFKIEPDLESPIESSESNSTGAPGGALAGQRKLLAALEEISDALCIPIAARRTALRILERNRSALNGRPARAMAAAALASAIRVAGVPIKFDQFVALSGEGAGTMKRYFRCLHAQRKPHGAGFFLPIYAERAGFGPRGLAEARETLARFEAACSPVGSSPSTVAAAIVALVQVGGTPSRFRECARSVDTPTSTLHEAMRRIHRALNGTAHTARVGTVAPP